MEAGLHPYLTFRVAGQHFALSSNVVRGILPTSVMLPLPRMPSGLAGVARYGTLSLIVVNLRERLSLADGKTGVSAGQRLVIVEKGATRGGISFASIVREISMAEKGLFDKTAARDTVATLSADDQKKLAALLVDRVTGINYYRARDFQQGAFRGQGRPRRYVDVNEVLTQDDLACVGG